MEQILENKIGKTVPFGVVSEAMNEPVGPVDNIIEKVGIHSLSNHDPEQGFTDRVLIGPQYFSLRGSLTPNQISVLL